MIKSTLEPTIKEYCFCFIRIEVDTVISAEYLENVKKCFSIIRKYDGDINQFMAGIILVLFGVPIKFGDIEENSTKCFNELKNSGLNISVFLEKDNGLYGIIGDEKRAIGTALSEKIFNTLKQIMNCPNGTYCNNLSP